MFRTIGRLACILLVAGGVARLEDPGPVLPIHSPYCDAGPVHWKVTADDGSVEPLAGLLIDGRVNAV